jgi:hypothetical protein
VLAATTAHKTAIGEGTCFLRGKFCLGYAELLRRSEVAISAVHLRRLERVVAMFIADVGRLAGIFTSGKPSA